MMPYFSLKPSMTSVSWFPTGKHTISLENTLFMALHVSCTMIHTVHLATPKRSPTLLYSHGVVRHHSVIATRCSTVMDLRIFMSCLSICGLSFVQIKKKVSLLTQKLASQSESEKVRKTTYPHHVLYLYDNKENRA